MSFEEFSYDVKDFIKVAKNDVGIVKPVRVFPIKNRALALSRVKDIPEMELPTTPTIMKEMGISQEEAVSRSKVAVLEEACHIFYNEGHTPKVYECVRSRVEKFLSPQEQELVKLKMDRFRAQAEEVALTGVESSSSSLGSGLASEVEGSSSLGSAVASEVEGSSSLRSLPPTMNEIPPGESSVPRSS